MPTIYDPQTGRTAQVSQDEAARLAAGGEPVGFEKTFGTQGNVKFQAEQITSSGGQNPTQVLVGTNETPQPKHFEVQAGVSSPTATITQTQGQPVQNIPQSEQQIKNYGITRSYDVQVPETIGVLESAAVSKRGTSTFGQDIQVNQRRESIIPSLPGMAVSYFGTAFQPEFKTIGASTSFFTDFAQGKSVFQIPMLSGGTGTLPTLGGIEKSGSETASRLAFGAPIVLATGKQLVESLPGQAVDFIKNPAEFGAQTLVGFGRIVRSLSTGTPEERVASATNIAISGVGGEAAGFGLGRLGEGIRALPGIKSAERTSLGKSTETTTTITEGIASKLPSSIMETRRITEITRTKSIESLVTQEVKTNKIQNPADGFGIGTEIVETGKARGTSNLLENKLGLQKIIGGDVRVTKSVPLEDVRLIGGAQGRIDSLVGYKGAGEAAPDMMFAGFSSKGYSAILREEGGKGPRIRSEFFSSAKGEELAKSEDIIGIKSLESGTFPFRGMSQARFEGVVFRKPRSPKIGKTKKILGKEGISFEPYLPKDAQAFSELQTAYKFPGKFEGNVDEFGKLTGKGRDVAKELGTVEQTKSETDLGGIAANIGGTQRKTAISSVQSSALGKFRQGRIKGNRGTQRIVQSIGSTSIPDIVFKTGTQHNFSSESPALRFESLSSQDALPSMREIRSSGLSERSASLSMQNIGNTLGERSSEKVGERSGERLGERLLSRTSERQAERLGERLSQRFGERLGERLGERTSQRLGTSFGFRSANGPLFPSIGRSVGLGHGIKKFKSNEPKNQYTATLTGLIVGGRAKSPRGPLYNLGAQGKALSFSGLEVRLPGVRTLKTKSVFKRFKL